MERKKELSGGLRGGTVSERRPWSPVQGRGRLLRDAGRRASRAKPLDFKALSILPQADLPHSAPWECLECDELIRGELPLHLAQERLGHQASPPP